MRVSENGEVTLPPEVQRQTGLTPGAEVEIVVNEGAALLVKARPRPSLEQARAMVERMRGTGDYGMSGAEFVRWLRGPSADEELAGKE